jgi:glycosyltransferase involved in cell wall biosynthesis
MVDTISIVPLEDATSIGPPQRFKIAVLVPCHNEAPTIATVVRDFHDALPDASVYVYDNNSTDDTMELAKRAGASVRREPHQGKGHVVRRMFADLDADIYVMVDGDGTYDANAAYPAIAKLIDERLDLVNIARMSTTTEAYRPGHQLGNFAFTWLVAVLFGREFSDMLSGYKVFSRRFVKSFPALSKGFEIETELTIHALELTMPVAEQRCLYGERSPGSASKLNTLRDGARILRMIVRLLRYERPLAFFGIIGVVSIVAAFALGVPLVATYAETGLVPRLPTAVGIVGLALAGIQSITAGIILDAVTRSRRETRRVAYLQIPAVA